MTNWKELYRKIFNDETNGVEELNTFELLTELPEMDIDMDTQWAQFQSRIHPKQSKATGQIWLKIAASCSLIIAASYIVYLLLPGSTIILKNNTANNLLERLPDGTSVLLGSGAELSYQEDFESDRTLSFQGQAHFDVVKNIIPFRIKTDVAAIEVLGTKFYLKAEESVGIYLEEGSVQLQNDYSSAKLTPGQYAQIMGRKAPITISEKQPRNLDSWDTELLIFENSVLKDVLADLESHFNVSVDANKKLLNCKITAQFNHKELPEIMDVLASVLNAKIRKNGSNYYLQGSGCD